MYLASEISRLGQTPRERLVDIICRLLGDSGFKFAYPEAKINKIHSSLELNISVTFFAQGFKSFYPGQFLPIPLCDNGC